MKLICVWLVIGCMFYLSYSQSTGSSFCSQDYFMANSPVVCPLPRIRQAFGALTYDERKLYVRVIYQIKLHKGAYLIGSKSNSSLYDLFESIHSCSRNGMLHGTSAFIPQHKFLLWLYESAIRYIALVDGPIMNPPISQDDACSLTQPYWSWEQGYTGSNWNNMNQTDVFEYPDLFGDTTPQNGTYYVDTGYFSYLNGWHTDQTICNPTRSVCDYFLKRAFIQTALTTSVPAIIGYILNNKNFTQFLPYIHGGLHGMIHTYIGFAMSITSTSAMDPLFYMHHANIDRLWHTWVDCHGFENVTPSALNNSCPQYQPVNPIGNIANQVKKDPIYGFIYPVTIDSILTYFTSYGLNSTIIPPNQWPTIRQMWSMGEEGNPGWCGLYYRYGIDTLIPLLKNCTDQNWTWVNQAA